MRISRLFFVIALVFDFLALSHSSAFAEYTLPYSTRTKDYSGWTPAPRGEINSIGMAGATVAIPSSIAAAEYNVAGFAMQTQSISAQINNITIYDQRLQKNHEELSSNQVGVAVSPTHWGFSFAYYSKMKEGGNYIMPNVGRSIYSEVAMGEYRFTVARAWLKSRLSVGASFKWMKATREINLSNYNSMGASYQLGALYRLDDRVILGLSYSPAVKIDAESGNAPQYDLPGFNRAVKLPSQFALGVGWIPNRFLKAGFGLHYTGLTTNTALLANQNQATGSTPTWTPRMGASYVLGEYQDFKMELAVGTYYEASRIEGEVDRLHATLGFEVMPYFLNTGIGFDLSKDYRNLVVSIGLNVVKTAAFFDIIPRDPLPPANRFFPPMMETNPDGLAPGLTEGEKTTVPAQGLGDINQIVKDIPQNIQKKFEGKTSKVEVKNDKIEERNSKLKPLIGKKKKALIKK